MMKILFFSFGLLLVSSHDIQVAIFTIYEDKETVHVDFLFEKEDLLIGFESEDKTDLNNCLQLYIQQNFSITINHEEQVLDIGEAEHKDKHISIKGKTKEHIDLIKSLEISNTCLLNINDHSNIIQLRLHDQERDFLMNSDRTFIKLNY